MAKDQLAEFNRIDRFLMAISRTALRLGNGCCSNADTLDTLPGPEKVEDLDLMDDDRKLPNQ